MESECKGRNEVERISRESLQMKYEREHRQREILQVRLADMEKELLNRQQQSNLLAQLHIDIKRLHLAFDALEVRPIRHFSSDVQRSFTGGKRTTHSPIDPRRNESFVIGPTLSLIHI